MAKTWLEEIVVALRRLGGTATYAELYEEIADNRESELPPTWQEIVRRTVQKSSSDSQAFSTNSRGADLFFAVEGIGRGTWGLRELAEVTTPSSEIPPSVNTIEVVESGKGNQVITATGSELPGRVKTEVYRILRDTKLARQAKLLHRHRCQVCGYTIKIGDGRSYSEAHHIIPLGGIHKGPDTLSNIIVLCPNHHAVMDMGLMKLELKNLRQIDRHIISAESIRYHNEEIFRAITT